MIITPLKGAADASSVVVTVALAGDAMIGTAACTSVSVVDGVVVAFSTPSLAPKVKVVDAVVSGVPAAGVKVRLSIAAVSCAAVPTTV